MLSEGSYLWNQFLTNLEFCQRFQIKPIDVHYLACTLIRFHIHKNFVVGRGIRTHDTSAKPKEDSRSVSTAIGAGAIKSASVITKELISYYQYRESNFMLETASPICKEIIFYK